MDGQYQPYDSTVTLNFPSKPCAFQGAKKTYKQKRRTSTGRAGGGTGVRVLPARKAVHERQVFFSPRLPSLCSKSRLVLFLLFLHPNRCHNPPQKKQHKHTPSWNNFIAGNDARQRRSRPELAIPLTRIKSTRIYARRSENRKKHSLAKKAKTKAIKK